MKRLLADAARTPFTWSPIDHFCKTPFACVTPSTANEEVRIEAGRAATKCVDIGYDLPNTTAYYPIASAPVLAS